MNRAVRYLLSAALLTVTPSFAAEQWLRLVTPNFEMYTSAGEKQGRAAILHFEQVRNFFLRASPVKSLSDVPVRIVEFGSDDEYRRYTISAAAVAYYVPGAARDFIVMDEERLTDFSVATHEYTHLIVRHSGLRLPAWLNEGWADVYASLRPLKNEAAIGDLLPARVTELNKEDWLSFDELTAVTTASPTYNETTRVGIFYAESWALAHMLYLSPEYADNFGKFIMALNQGKSSDEACQIAWGKPGTKILEELRSYLKRKKLVGRVYETRLLKEELEPVVEPANEFDLRLGLAELLAATRRPEEAAKAFVALDAQRPGRPEIARSLGFIALQSQDRANAIRYFEQAFERGETDARMCYTLAMLERDAQQKPDLVVTALERAIKSRPGYTDAEINLGTVRMSQRDFREAIAVLMRISVVTPDRAPTVFCSLSLAYLETGDIASARTNAETCRKWARSEAETGRLNQLTRMIEARAKPGAGVRLGEKIQLASGTVRSLECSGANGTGPARLQVVVSGQLQTFDFPEPAAVELNRLDPAGASDFQLRCGPLQAAPVKVEYAPPLDPAGGSVGIARRVQF